MVGRVVAATGDVRLVCRSWFTNLCLLLHHLLTHWVIYACWALYVSGMDKFGCLIFGYGYSGMDKLGWVIFLGMGTE